MSKSIQIQTQLDKTPFQVLGDSNRLKQVIWNLLSNAVKFTPHGGQVTIQLKYTDSSALLQIIDTGKGISDEFLPQVFEHFQQADSTTTRVFGGLGLGLAIAKQIVDMHEGTIQATSPGEGLGATFTVELPLTITPFQTSNSDEHFTADAELKDLHVLLVEDDADNREMVIQTLEMYGASVTAASSASSAMDILSRFQPDVLISDIGMSEVDGYMLMQQIRQITQTSQIPGIALTAYASEADRQRALEAGFQEHLPKPMEPTQLIKAILKIVKNHQTT